MTRYLMTLGISKFLSIVMILWLFKISSPSVRKAHTKILVDKMTGSLGFQNYLELSNARIQGGIFLASIGIIA